MVEKMNGQLAVLCDRILGVYSRSFARLDELYEVYQKDIMKNVDKAFYYQGTNFLAVDGTRERSGNTETVKFDFLEWRNFILCFVWLQERIFSLIFHFLCIGCQQPGRQHDDCS